MQSGGAINAMQNCLDLEVKPEMEIYTLCRAVLGPGLLFLL